MITCKYKKESFYIYIYIVANKSLKFLPRYEYMYDMNIHICIYMIYINTLSYLKTYVYMYIQVKRSDGISIFEYNKNMNAYTQIKGGD
jgi:hypothetical protein